MRLIRVVEKKAPSKKQQEDNVNAAELDFLDLEILIKETAGDLDLFELRCCIEDNNLGHVIQYRSIT